jgi:sortase (surface protein transpeptidase)
MNYKAVSALCYSIADLANPKEFLMKPLRLLLLAFVATLLASVGVAQAAPSASSAVKPAPGDPVRIVIPAINLDRPLLSVGLDKRRVPIVPKHDIGWYNLSAKPRLGENIVLWGHVLRFKATPKIPAPFARLKELEVGARVTLYTADGVAHPYRVIEKVWATPDEVEYILPRGRELVTMVSCIGDKVVTNGSVEMTHRLITIAAPVK